LQQVEVMAFEHYLHVIVEPLVARRVHETMQVAE